MSTPHITKNTPRREAVESHESQSTAIGGGLINSLHLVTQRNQPYGSVRRCCEQCGAMCWPGTEGSAQRWTDDPVEYERASDKCVSILAEARP